MSLSPRAGAMVALAIATPLLTTAPAAQAAPVVVSPPPICSIGGLGDYALPLSFDVTPPSPSAVQGKAFGLPVSVSLGDLGPLVQAGVVTVSGAGSTTLTARQDSTRVEGTDSFPVSFDVPSQLTSVEGSAQPGTFTGSGNTPALISASSGDLFLDAGTVSFTLVGRDRNGGTVTVPQGDHDSDGDPTTFDVVCVPAVTGATTAIADIPVRYGGVTSPVVPNFGPAPKVVELTDTSVSVVFTPPSSITYPVTNFSVLLDGKVVGSTFVAGKGGWQVTGLAPGSTHTIRTEAYTVAGSSPSAVTTFTTTGGTPTGPPSPTPTPPVGTPTPGPTPTPPVSTPTPSPTPTPPVSTPTPGPTPTYGFDIAGSATLRTLVKGTVPIKGSILLGLGLDTPLTGDLVLGQSQASLRALGILPVTATVNLVSTGRVTGLLKPSGELAATATVRIKLPSIKTFGIQLAGGANCQATQVSTIPLTGTLSPLRGGTITGTFAISNLSGCGALTGIVSPLTAGAGNSIALKLTPNGQGAQ